MRVFEDCVLADTSLYAANLARTRWQRCRAGHADFASADLVDACFESSDLNTGTPLSGGVFLRFIVAQHALPDL